MTMISLFRRARQTPLPGTPFVLTLVFLAHAFSARAEEPGGFSGAWRNIDPASRSFQRIVIGEKAGQTYMDCWDAAGDNRLQLMPRDRIYLNVPPEELRTAKVITKTQESSFVTVEYRLTLEDGKVVLWQKHTFLDPKEAAIEATATYVRENPGDAPRVEGLMGNWRNAAADSRPDRIVIFEAKGKVFLSFVGTPIELPVSVAQAYAGEGTPLSVDLDWKNFKETVTLTLQGRSLTFTSQKKYSSGVSTSTVKLQPVD